MSLEELTAFADWQKARNSLYVYVLLNLKIADVVASIYGLSMMKGEVVVGVQGVV